MIGAKPRDYKTPKYRYTNGVKRRFFPFLGDAALSLFLSAGGDRGRVAPAGMFVFGLTGLGLAWLDLVDLVVLGSACRCCLYSQNITCCVSRETVTSVTRGFDAPELHSCKRVPSVRGRGYRILYLYTYTSTTAEDENGSSTTSIDVIKLSLISILFHFLCNKRLGYSGQSIDL